MSLKLSQKKQYWEKKKRENGSEVKEREHDIALRQKNTQEAQSSM